MNFKFYFEHTKPLFQKLKILNIFKINDYLSCLFIYRFKHLQNLPEFFNGYFIQNNEVHHYNTRNSNKLHVNYSRTDYEKHTIYAICQCSRKYIKRHVAVQFLFRFYRSIYSRYLYV